MSNAERAYIGLCSFFALVILYSVVASQGRIQIVLNALLLLFSLILLRFHRRERQQRDLDQIGDH